MLFPGLIRLGRGQVKYCRPLGPPVNSTCQFCSNSHHIGGPIWIAPLHDQEFVSDLMDSLTEERFSTVSRMRGMLSMVLEELPDLPLYYELSRLCNITKLSQGKITEYLSAILNAGYRVSLTHANKVRQILSLRTTTDLILLGFQHGIKTDAPTSFLWSMMRAWARKIGKVKDNLSEGSPGKTIMMIRDETDDQISFEEHPLANPESRKKNLKRFQINPEKNWGPKMRSKTSTLKNMENAKRIRNQGKLSKKHNTESSGNDSEVKKAKMDGCD